MFSLGDVIDTGLWVEQSSIACESIAQCRPAFEAGNRPSLFVIAAPAVDAAVRSVLLDVELVLDDFACPVALHAETTAKWATLFGPR